MNSDEKTSAPELSLTKMEHEVPALNKYGGGGFDFQSLMQMAIEKGDVGIVERMMAVRKDLNAERARELFDDAMRQFQAECPPIEKTVGVPLRSGGIAYHYAPIEHIAAAIKPFVEKHGFSYAFDTDTTSQKDWVIALCIVKHVGGHSQTTSMKLPIGAGTQIMSQTQVYAGALTFANRRALQNAFGLTIVGEDRDGAGAGNKGEKPPGPSSIQGDKKPDSEDITLKKKLTDMTRAVHMIARGYALDDTARNKLTQWLIDENFINDTETVGSLAGKRLADVVRKIENSQRGG